MPRMACDHIGPQEVVDYAEQILRERGIPPERWTGTRATWSGNAESGIAVHIEVLRDADDWRVTKLERQRDVVVPESEAGFRVLEMPLSPRA